eukprot:gene18623-20500_t
MDARQQTQENQENCMEIESDNPENCIQITNNSENWLQLTDDNLGECVNENKSAENCTQIMNNNPENSLQIKDNPDKCIQNKDNPLKLLKKSRNSAPAQERTELVCVVSEKELSDKHPPSTTGPDDKQQPEKSPSLAVPAPPLSDRPELVYVVNQEPFPTRIHPFQQPRQPFRLPPHPQYRPYQPFQPGPGPFQPHHHQQPFLNSHHAVYYMDYDHHPPPYPYTPPPVSTGPPPPQLALNNNGLEGEDGGDGGPTAEKPVKRRTGWTHENARFLIQLWADNNQAIKGDDCRLVWRNVLEKFHERFPAMAASVDLHKAKRKINYHIDKYKAVLTQWQKDKQTFGGKQQQQQQQIPDRKKCEFFDLIDGVLENEETLPLAVEELENSKGNNNTNPHEAKVITAKVITIPGPSNAFRGAGADHHHNNNEQADDDDEQEHAPVSATTNPAKSGHIVARTYRKKSNNKPTAVRRELEQERIDDALDRLTRQGDALVETVKKMEENTRQQTAAIEQMSQCLGRFFAKFQQSHRPISKRCTSHSCKCPGKKRFRDNDDSSLDESL